MSVVAARERVEPENEAASASRALAAERPLALELEFTRTYRQAHESIAARELACLRVMFPTILRPIQPGDALAGRIDYPLVGFSPEPGNFGYYSRERDLLEVLERAGFEAATADAAREMIDFWRGEKTRVRVRGAYPAEVAAALPHDEWTEEEWPAFPLYRIGGLIPDYGKLLRRGIPGLRAELLARAGTVDPQVRPFLEAAAAACDLLAGSCLHYERQARSLAASGCGDAAHLGRMADSLAAIAGRAPETLREAAQLAWLYALHSGAWNYGRMDVYLGPFLAADLAAGRTSEAEALDLLCGWWRLMRAGYYNHFNNRVVVGGIGREREAEADRFALLAIEATRRVCENQPQLTLRFHRGQDERLMAAALTCLGEGRTFPLLYNDDANVPAVEQAFTVRREEAEQYVPYGCGEYILEHRSVGSANGVINLTKCLELALRDGVEPASGRQAGPRTGTAASFLSFEDLWSAYERQVEHFVAALATQEATEYRVFAGEAPLLFASALYDDCVARAKPLLAGGARHLGGTLETYGNVTAADSLSAIRDLVFERHLCTLPELVAALDADWVGHEQLRRACRNAPKFGNDHPQADAMAARLHEHVCRVTRQQAARVGLDSYLVVVINNNANVVLGRRTRASADGRQAGELLANGNNPTPGADKEGVTAFLNSLLKLDAGQHAGAVQNMKFSRELFKRERAKLEALLEAYWAGGGTQAMITVLDPADLEAAMREPEKWGHLMVRVGGFSARFVNLEPDTQREILRRTLHS